MMGDSDARLVLRVRAGDRSAAERLARRYLPAIRACALAIVGNIRDAEDVCQDAFVTAMRDLADCRAPDRFGAWLAQIARHRALDLVRQRSVHAAVSLEHVELSHEPVQLIEVGRSELRDKLLAALAQLSEAQRTVILLHDVEGWKHREIAKFMDLPHGTVRSHVHHARARLRELLRAYKEEGL